jgi:biopolymer transport protein ExbD
MDAHGEQLLDPAAEEEKRRKLHKLRRKLIRKMPEPEEVAYLNITAMMDMMTIILVFFLKNFATTSTNVNLTPDLALPSSSSQIEPHQAVAITVTAKGILVENDEVASVKRGRVDASVKRDGENGFFISPLYEMLDKHQRRLKKLEELSGGGQPFRGEIIVIADKRTPYRLMSEVIYTAGQADFNKYRLLVLQKGGG